MSESYYGSNQGRKELKGYYKKKSFGDYWQGGTNCMGIKLINKEER